MNFLHYLSLKGKDSQGKTGHARSDTQARALVPAKGREPGNSTLPLAFSALCPLLALGVEGSKQQKGRLYS